jgi:hypothetical protein
VLVRAEAKWVRTSARKARTVLEHIRGRTVPEARTILAFMQRADQPYGSQYLYTITQHMIAVEKENPRIWYTPDFADTSGGTFGTNDLLDDMLAFTSRNNPDAATMILDPANGTALRYLESDRRDGDHDEYAECDADAVRHQCLRGWNRDRGERAAGISREEASTMPHPVRHGKKASENRNDRTPMRPDRRRT